MEYFTERNNMRKPNEKTNVISIDMYRLLFECCKDYFDNISWRYPKKCPDGDEVCGLDWQKFNDYLKFEIPNLYRDEFGNIAKPGEIEDVFSNSSEVIYDQYALLDYIEFIYANCLDIVKSEYHKYFKHNDLFFSDGRSSANDFRLEINHIFNKTGLLFFMNEKGQIERIIENEILDDKVEEVIEIIPEDGIKNLVKLAIEKHRSPKEQDNQEAVKIIWDAFERLKSYYAQSKKDKRNSIDIILNDMSHGDSYYYDLFNAEIKALTDDIGNACNIRHSETYQHDIIDKKYYDYFFNRCLSLISLAIQYLK